MRASETPVCTLKFKKNVNMNWIMLLIGLSSVVLVWGEQYTDRYDNIDIDDILNNKRLLNSYIKCVLDQGRCTAEGKELKLHIKDAMQTACSKCTEVQKKQARRVVRFIRETDSETWGKLKTKYDPGDKYQPIYEPFLDAEED